MVTLRISQILKITARKKQAAAYQVKRCAVKKIQKENKGKEKTRKRSPAMDANLGDLFITKKINKIRKRISCGFIVKNFTFHLNILGEIHGCL